MSVENKAQTLENHHDIRVSSIIAALNQGALGKDLYHIL